MRWRLIGIITRQRVTCKQDRRKAKRSATDRGTERRSNYGNETYLTSRDSIQNGIPRLTTTLAAGHGHCTGGTGSGRGIGAFAASGLAGPAGGAYAIVYTLDLASSAAGAGDGGPHARLLRTPSARLRDRALVLGLHWRQRTLLRRGGREDWQGRSSLTRCRISRKTRSGRAVRRPAARGIGCWARGEQRRDGR